MGGRRERRQIIIEKGIISILHLHLLGVHILRSDLEGESCGFACSSATAGIILHEGLQALEERFLFLCEENVLFRMSSLLKIWLCSSL